jgi:isoleucyl-tRNA synthetase
MIGARESVLRYDKEWKRIIPRIGRWVDMDNAYLTMNWTYSESIWWSFKTLHEHNLIYQAFKPMHICPHCETTLSNFEVSQGYKDITDISVYVAFELKDNPRNIYSRMDDDAVDIAG